MRVLLANIAPTTAILIAFKMRKSSAFLWLTISFCSILELLTAWVARWISIRGVFDGQVRCADPWGNQANPPRRRIPAGDGRFIRADTSVDCLYTKLYRHARAVSRGPLPVSSCVSLSVCLPFHASPFSFYSSLSFILPGFCCSSCGWAGECVCVPRSGIA